jgi:NAD(P)H-flavin reductase
MLLDLAERGVERPATFFYSARSASDLIWRDEMEELSRRLPEFRYVPVLTRPKSADAWKGESGGMPASLARLLPALDHHEAYLCGGPGLIDASIGALMSLGLSEKLIFFDKFS